MLAFQTPAAAPPWKRRLVYSPLARIVIFALLAAASLMVLSLIVAAMGLDAKDAPAGPRGTSIFLRHLIPFLGMYLVLVHFIERREPRELAWNKVLPHGLAGFACGFLLISTVVGVLWLAGAYEVTGTDPGVNWIKPLVSIGLAVAIAEEIVFRGILFRISEEGLGTWPALAISATLFGALHLANPNATWWSAVAIAVEAGLLLGLAYHVTRSLPFVIGLHMAWNFTQGTVYGIPVSGGKAAGWLVSQRPGPDWLSGGIFGAEASVVAVAISLALSAALIVHARRRGSIVVRRWRGGPSIEPISRDAPC